MGTSRQISESFEAISTDLIGPLPRSRNGNTYILVTVDLLSKYVILHPLRRATAETVSKCIEDVILTYGAPKSIIADNGPQFRSRTFQEMCASYHCTIRYTIPYNPRSNPTERMNQTLEAMIRCYVKDKHNQWDEKLQFLQYALRSNVSEATGVSPQTVVFGKDISLDGRHHLAAEDASLEEETTPLYLEKKFLRRQQLLADIKERLRKGQDTNRRGYNQRRRDVSYTLGQWVWRKNFVLSDAAKRYSAKLAPGWIGPYKIKRKLGKVSYMLEDRQGHDTGPWHADQLKPHYGDVAGTRHFKAGGDL